MFTQYNQGKLLAVTAIALFGSTSLLIGSSETAVANSHTGTMTLSCVGRLGDVAKQDGMTLEYNSQQNKVTVNFIKIGGATTASAGQCVVTGQPWNSTTVGKFCHFGVNDVIYKRNKSSINIISAQAPYLLKIVKTGQPFSLSVRANDARCPHGLTVVG